MESGAWLVLEHANLCSATVLDRLNSLMEEDGELVLSECGTGKDGTARVLRRHPNFRLFLTMNPTFGPISRPMRNRCVENLFSFFLFFVVCCFFALFIDLLTDKVQPLSIGDQTMPNTRPWSTAPNVRAVFMIHVGGTRCVTSSTAINMKIHARITLTVECIRTCIFIF